MTFTTTLRCRRIRFKNGQTIEVLRPPTDNVMQKFRGDTERIMSASVPMTGYAIVAWYADGLVVPAYCNSAKSPILAGQVPQYVKDVLLAETALRWTKNT